MKQRAERMAQVVRKIVSSELLKLLPQGHVTLTQVKISDDLRYGTIWLSSFAPNKPSPGELMAAVEEHHTQLQQALNSQIKTRYVPQLRFRIDSGWQHADRVDELLDELGS